VVVHENLLPIVVRQGAAYRLARSAGSIASHGGMGDGQYRIERVRIGLEASRDETGHGIPLEDQEEHDREPTR
jgi:hypothetical protein